jgi:Fe-S-cluster-containing hydrogenase component 2
MEGSEMIFDMPTCGGCRTCEIACSYHHTGEFKPSVSSIKILDKKDESPGRLVLLVEEDDGQSIPCDGCQGLEEPLCIEACETKEKLQEMIKEYLKKVGSGKKVSKTA